MILMGELKSQKILVLGNSYKCRVNACKKTPIFSGTEGTAHPDPRGTQASRLVCSRRDHKQSRWYLSHCVPGRDIPLPRTQIKKITQNTGHGTQIENHQSVDERVLGKLPDCSSYLSNIFPEFQIPYLHFFLLIKKAGLKGNIRQFVRVQNPPSFQITGLLNKAPIKIQYLSLLIGSGRDSSTNIGFFSFNFNSFIFSDICLMAQNMTYFGMCF